MAIGIAAFFAYGLLLTVVSGDSRAAGDILRAVVALVVIAAFGLGAWWIRTQPRRRSAEAAAYELGLRFSAVDVFDLIDLPFALFNRLASVRRLENVMYGTWRGLEVKLFDYWYARSSDPSIDDIERFTCLMISLGTSWPSLLIEPETAAARLAGRVTLKEIEFESEAFNRAFTVRGDDPRFASAFVDGRMMRWLLPPKGVGVPDRRRCPVVLSDACDTPRGSCSACSKRDRPSSIGPRPSPARCIRRLRPCRRRPCSRGSHPAARRASTVIGVRFTG